jgi:hypothetical protein
LTHLRKIARTSASIRFAVALLQPRVSFSSVTLSSVARLMAPRSLPPRKGSSQRSVLTSALAVALCDFSLSYRTTASFQLRRGFSPNFEIRHNSDFSRS